MIKVFLFTKGLINHLSGWWYTYPSEKKKKSLVNGKDDIPYIMENNNVWNHQPAIIGGVTVVSLW